MKKTVVHYTEDDVANELTRDLRIESSVLCRSVMGPPWGFGIAERDVGSFHMVLDGQGWLEVDGSAEPVPLGAGDLLVLPRGDAHRVKDSLASASLPLTTILAQNEVVDGELHFGGDDGPLTEIVCGVFSLDGIGAAPWMDRLPNVVRSDAHRERTDWRRAAAVALRDEARAPTKGGAVVVNRLLESLLADAIRSELTRMAIDVDTPHEALAHRRIGTALARLHERPGSPWTVESLAQAAVMSRSAFSERFRSIVGEAPMQYVRRLRLARAVRLLRSTDATVAEIAKDVGYTSEEALSRAFKKRFGEAPSLFRRRARLPAAALPDESVVVPSAQISVDL